MNCKMQQIQGAVRQMGKQAHEKSARESNFFGAIFAVMGAMRGARPFSLGGVIYCLMLVMFIIYMPKRIFWSVRDLRKCRFGK